MIAEISQAVAETAKNPGILSGAGRQLIDGTIIVALLKLFEALISRYKGRQARAKARLEKLELVTPAPKPGESDICKDHLDQIKDLRGKVERQGREIAGLAEFRGNTNESLKRIETKVDDLKDLIIGRERA